VKEREELLRAVRARLARVDALQDWAPVLEESALTQAEQLAATLNTTRATRSVCGFGTCWGGCTCTATKPSRLGRTVWI
jgi:hypothetical protein